MRGLTIGIIGGRRSEQAAQITECNILAHPGNSIDVDLESLLKESDELVVLTKFVSHQAMWAAKAYAIDQDKPIHYTKSINIHRILDGLKKAPAH